MSLFDQIAGTANPKNLEQSLNNFDVVHAELKEAIELLNRARAYVAMNGVGSDKVLEKIDNFLTKHS